MVIIQLIAGKVLKKMLSFFYAAQMLTLMIVFGFPMPANIELILKSVKDTIELNAIPKDKIKKALSGAPEG